MKNFLILITVLWGLFSCQEKAREGEYREISGETMGTYYRITLESTDGLPTQETVETWLLNLNQALSTYIPSSVISSFNHAQQGIGAKSIDNRQLAKYFFENVAISSKIYAESHGSFDPTVMPLVNYWGFGYDHGQLLTEIDSQLIDSLLDLVGFDRLMVTGHPTDSIAKPDARIQLDFSAVAKGYAIDVIGQYLEDSFSIANYLIDIGGESRARGVNREGNTWRIGINEPVENSPFSNFKFIVELKDKSIATSGNYRNFYEVNGQKISHTINPHTGFYERNDLLSASILTQSCGYADGYATACMAMGFEKAKHMVENDDQLDAILIYIDSDNEIKHYITKRIEQFITPSK
ncbi:MAG: FAD:protein FMN transferase [Saprospiraceae bacterium]|nr:FAD:protein FMN transferase [Saprospiraceae bacterium]